MERSPGELATSAYRQTTEEVTESLASRLDDGLTDAEASTKLEREGPNELEAEQPVPAWRRFLAQFQDVLVILLLVATARMASASYGSAASRS
jgi:P-type Ca2+ transporter type 2C